MDYFFQNLFNGIATLLSVGVVLWVFYSQKRIEKVNAARVLLLEIQNAEKSIAIIKETGAVSQLTFVLPNNNWNNYRHLFVADLDADELDLLSRFYNSCLMVETEVRQMKNYLVISNEEKIKLTQHKILELGESHKGKNIDIHKENDYVKDRRNILEDLFFKEDLFFEPYVSKNRLRDYLPHIPIITVSSCGQKLKRIAYSKGFRLFH